MKNAYLIATLLASTFAGGCSFENSAGLLGPTAPSGNVGSSTGTTKSTSNGNGAGSSTATPASAFSGAWGSSSLGGLPVGNCADLKWLITEQTSTTVGGAVSATCANGASLSANLLGQLSGTDKINLTANGTIVALGLSCPFSLTGVGTRQSNDSMKLDYNGTHCLGTVSGSENLRRFPAIP